MKRKTLRIYNKPEAFIDNLVKKGERFTVEKTTSKLHIKTATHDYTYQANFSDIKPSEMFFFNYLKSNIIERPLEDFETIRARINYIYYNRQYLTQARHNNIKITFKKCYEIDLNSAYWESAKRLQIIDDKTYQMGLKVSKKVRLMALGNLAKRPVSMVFDGKKYKSKRADPPTTSKYFFACADYTDNLIADIFNRNAENCIFYWVDALFCTEDAKEPILARLNEINFPYKIKEIDKIEINPSFIETFFYSDKLEKNTTKIYNFEKISEDKLFFKDFHFEILQKINSKP